MARPLRIAFAGACYHVTARGNERRPIYADDQDREHFLARLEAVVRRHRVVLHAYVLMRNHYHLLLETPEANLARAMRQLNGVYTQDFNRRHRRVGHLLQGRYKALLIDKDSYLLEVSRYIHLNPVRVAEVADAASFPWSSAAAYVGRVRSPAYLRTEAVLNHFGRRRRTAQRAYARFLKAGVKGQTGRLWNKVVAQSLLGEDPEVPATRQLRPRPPVSLVITQLSRAARVPREAIARPAPGRVRPARVAAIHLAWELCGLTQRELGSAFGVTHFAVSKTIRRAAALLAHDSTFRKLTGKAATVLQT
jgi:putative transposase